MGQTSSHQFEIIQTITDPRYGKINLINYNSAVLALKSLTFHTSTQFNKLRQTVISLKHPNLLEVYQLAIQSDTMPQFCDNGVNAYAVLEYLPHSLQDAQTLQEHQIYRMFQSFIEMLAFLQRNQISTNNLSAQNISLTSTFQLKLNPIQLLLDDKIYDHMKSSRVQENPYKVGVYNLGVTMLMTCLRQQKQIKFY